MCDAVTIKKLKVALQNLAMECDIQGASGDSASISKQVNAAYVLLYELDQDSNPKCQGCGRKELNCSADPCQDVEDDRNE